MKILICGKGGCGKSSVTALLAIELEKRGYKVIVVDNDESNFGLHIQLGMELPNDFALHFGGKRMVAEKLLKSKEGEKFSVFNDGIRASDIPEDYMSKKGGLNLIAIGKIREFGEGCACPFNALSADFLRMLELSKREFALVDTDAGVEHFGRGVEAGCDLILMVIDPSQESIRLAEKVNKISEGAGKPLYYVLNKTDDETARFLLDSVDQSKVVSVIPADKRVFRNCLVGEALNFELKGIIELADFLERKTNMDR
uniref:CODH nickel-insertion accessory protein n=2 Tax=unclassified Candidatus Methanophaga TaxID=3386245 RepID=Q64A39_UNCAG|nr:CODH nickel-insertion accessory protein [uncultured archaeon GZfos33E1]QNO55864.1 iron-sulfur cluster carrier protein [Methanosarcinales archaeon ANME-1 ERB7]